MLFNAMQIFKSTIAMNMKETVYYIVHLKAMYTVENTAASSAFLEGINVKKIFK
jgi:hypothetical protein